jgi:quercetin dioxygenase-like cupin family protein
MALLGAILLAMLSNPSPSQPLKVETKGVTAAILHEAPIVGGHLPELAGKYKLRITEITIAPGGHVGEHNHRGPGIRKMTEGSMNYIMPDKSVVYASGDNSFEAGDVNHRVVNDSGTACKHLLFEILPKEVEGPSLIPAQSRSPH